MVSTGPISRRSLSTFQAMELTWRSRVGLTRSRRVIVETLRPVIDEVIVAVDGGCPSSELQFLAPIADRLYRVMFQAPNGTLACAE
jgi:hypothetical protein